MSASPPPDQLPDIPQLAGRRRKRSETPPPAPAITTGTPPTPLEQTAPSSSFQGARAAYSDSAGPQYSYAASYPQPVPSSYGAGSSMGLVTSSPESRYAPGQVSPRTTRKTKAHVASACVNCKKKHLRCDSARPCRRCTQSGKEDSCKDVEHKKRGRPPLRPDEPSRRSFDPTLHPLMGRNMDPARQMPTADPATFTQPSYSRNFRPLQAQPTYDSRTQMRPPSAYPSYALPSVSPSTATAMGSFYQSGGSYLSSSIPMATPGAQFPSATPPAQYPSTYGYFPQQEQMNVPQQTYSNPIFPREPQVQQRSAMGYGASLQLPPIRPAPERSHSSIDPNLAQQQTGQQQERPSSTGTTRQPDSKRTKMDIEGILSKK